MPPELAPIPSKASLQLSPPPFFVLCSAMVVVCVQRINVERLGCVCWYGAVFGVDDNTLDICCLLSSVDNGSARVCTERRSALTVW